MAGFSKSPRSVGLLAVAVACVLGFALTSIASGGDDHPGAEIEFTPAPEPMATPVTQQVIPEAQMAFLLRTVGWPDSVIPDALSVIGCESGFHRFRVGDVGELGLFQIHPVHLARFRARYGLRADPSDPVQNAAIALDIWREEGWAPWSCQPAR